MKSQKKVLIVSYCFPPQRNAESQLILASVRGLAEMGWEITVLTVNASQSGEDLDQELLSHVPDSVKVIRTAIFGSWLQKFPAANKYFWNGLQFLGLPERQFSWYFSAVKVACQLVRTEKFDCLHSWASYQVSNIVALHLKRKYQIPWLAHFSDPWIDSPYYNTVSRLRLEVSKFFERRIIDEVDGVVFTTIETANLVMKKYPDECQNKTVVIPHGYDPGMMPSPADVKLSSAELKPFTIVHCGAFYPGIREPVSLFRALAALKERHILDGVLKLRLIGPYSTWYRNVVVQYELESIVELLPPVSRHQSLVSVLEADLLLVIDAQANESVFLPSKLIDYLNFNKPIYAITPPIGPTASLLKEIGFRYNSPEDIDGIEKTLEQFLIESRAVKIALPEKFSEISEKYHIRNTSKILSSALEKYNTARVPGN